VSTFGPKARQYPPGEALVGVTIVERRSSVEALARAMCKQLYEFTNGQPMKWRKIIGDELMHRATGTLSSAGG